MACRSSFLPKDFVDIYTGNHSSSSSGNSDDNNSPLKAANVDHLNELFIGGSSLKLRQTVSQPSEVTMDMEDSIQTRNFTAKNNIASSSTYGGDASILRKAGGLATTMDIHRKESGGCDDGGNRGGSRRGTAHIIPWNRRDSFLRGSRPPSLLERSIIPRLRKHVRLPFPSSGEAEPAQMTIFYAGSVSVFDNVPADKAYAVMVLANQCSVQLPDPVSIDKTTPGLPLARQQSLKRFLEKRRDRMLNNSPYDK